MLKSPTAKAAAFSIASAVNFQAETIKTKFVGAALIFGLCFHVWLDQLFRASRLASVGRLVIRIAGVRHRRASSPAFRHKIIAGHLTSSFRLEY